MEQLSAKERELCASCRFLPAHYLAMKESLMRDCQQNGFLSRQDARSFFRWGAGRGLQGLHSLHSLQCVDDSIWE